MDEESRWTEEGDAAEEEEADGVGDDGEAKCMHECGVEGLSVHLLEGDVEGYGEVELFLGDGEVGHFG